VSKFRKYSPSLHASEAEMYSASVDDVDTVGCLAVMKLMRAPSTITQLPEKDFLSTMSWAQSESAMMVFWKDYSLNQSFWQNPVPKLLGLKH
jgi:hypothetical protein